jgi:hypothetical protein
MTSTYAGELDSAPFDKRRISRRTRDALVADLLADPDLADLAVRGLERIQQGPQDARDGAYDLARQLGIDGYGEVARVADMAGTLGYVISALDEVLRRKWPPSNEPDEYAVIADAATKSLTPLQVLATVLCAPDWTRKVSVNTTVNHLPDRSNRYLLRGLRRN